MKTWFRQAKETTQFWLSVVESIMLILALVALHIEYECCGRDPNQ